MNMPNYNFYDAFYASPLRFQQFACAVMSVRENCVFQRFGEGRDGGIDGLYVSGEERIVLQAKRTKVEGRALLSILRGERKKLQPGNAADIFWSCLSEVLKMNCKKRSGNCSRRSRVHTILSLVRI